jgi:NAD(P)H-dependent FMN reductase
VFVAPEYNHSTSGALKNAIDYLYREWHNKAAGFVGYGGTGGARAVEHLRLVMAELEVATVRNQVALSLFTDWASFTAFKPEPRREGRCTPCSISSSPGAVHCRRSGCDPAPQRPSPNTSKLAQSK